MFNPYSLILGLFTAAGLATSVWGWLVIARARKSAHWPSVQGMIETSSIAAEGDELLPDIQFSYRIADKDYLKNIEFPNSTSPTQEFSNHYVNKYPPGAVVAVYYNPDNPEQATLEPGLQPGDWMILAFGLGVLILMTVLLLIGA